MARVILNNPQRHNALGREQLEGIKLCLDEVASDRHIRVLVLSGAGSKTFCAGASLQELKDGHIGGDAFQTMTKQLADLSIPTICALNGDVFGGGVELAVSCDFRIGVAGSRMRVPAAEIGLCYPLCGINRIVEVLGGRAAMRILVAAEEFDDHGMRDIGFLDHVVDAQVLEEFTLNFAQRVADLAPLAVQAMKQILRQSAAGVVDPALVQELSNKCLGSKDLQEGFAAKRERRRPYFEGQ